MNVDDGARKSCFDYANDSIPTHSSSYMTRKTPTAKIVVEKKLARLL